SWNQNGDKIFKERFAKRTWYLHWKKIEHPAVGRVGNWIHGSPELVGEELKQHGYEIFVDERIQPDSRPKYPTVYRRKDRDSGFTKERFYELQRLAKQRSTCKICNKKGHYAPTCPSHKVPRNPAPQPAPVVQIVQQKSRHEIFVEWLMSWKNKFF